MLVFADESGDTGFKFDKGSSELFAVAAVWFRSDEAAVRCEGAISGLAQRAGRRREYRFSHWNHGTRTRFFDCVRNCEFRYASVVMNKRKITGKGFQHGGSFVKWHTCTRHVGAWSAGRDRASLQDPCT